MLDMKIIGENIRTERKRQLLTIDRLAEMVGITENFLGQHRINTKIRIIQ